MHSNADTLSRQESLRVLPPGPMTFRQAAKTDIIDGVLVPKGTIFYIPVISPVFNRGLHCLILSL